MGTLFWAGNAIAGKLAVGHVSPFTLTFLRWVCALIIVFGFAHKRLQQDWSTLRPNLIYLFVLGAIGFALFNNLMYLALTKTSAINVTILQSSLPLFIFVLNYFLFRVSATKLQYMGLLLTVIGVIAITTQGQMNVLLGLDFNSGDVIMLFAVLAYGLYSVMLNNKPDIHWLSFITVLACSALLSSIPFMLWELANNTLIWPDLTGWLIVLYTALFASLVSQLCWIRSVELIGSNATGLYINLVPLLGALMAVLLLGESFQLYHLLAMLMIIGGVTLARRSAIKSA